MISFVYKKKFTENPGRNVNKFNAGYADFFYLYRKRTKIFKQLFRAIKNKLRSAYSELKLFFFPL